MYHVARRERRCCVLCTPNNECGALYLVKNGCKVNGKKVRHSFFHLRGCGTVVVLTDNLVEQISQHVRPRKQVPDVRDFLEDIFLQATKAPRGNASAVFENKPLDFFWMFRSKGERNAPTMRMSVEHDLFICCGLFLKPAHILVECPRRVRAVGKPRHEEELKIDFTRGKHLKKRPPRVGLVRPPM